MNKLTREINEVLGSCGLEPDDNTLTIRLTELVKRRTRKARNKRKEAESSLEASERQVHAM
jgi:hypothetical protein